MCSMTPAILLGPSRGEPRINVAVNPFWPSHVVNSKAANPRGSSYWLSPMQGGNSEPLLLARTPTSNPFPVSTHRFLPRMARWLSVCAFSIQISSPLPPRRQRRNFSCLFPTRALSAITNSPCNESAHDDAGVLNSRITSRIPPSHRLIKSHLRGFSADAPSRREHVLRSPHRICRRLPPHPVIEPLFPAARPVLCTAMANGLGCN